MHFEIFGGMDVVLYHATFRKRLNSIKEHGLGAKQIKNWSISEDNVVYLSTDPDTAFLFCESAENISKSVYNSGIIVLAIESKVLHYKNLRTDINIKDETKSMIYRGVIDARYLQVVQSDKGIIGRLVDLKRVPAYK